MGFLNTIKNQLLNLLFPAKCIACQEKDVYFCQKCLSLSPTAGRESQEWIFPVFDYRHPPIKKALWLLKYKNKKGFADVFAKILYEKILEEISDLSLMENFYNPILIPIPLSKKRQRERGYNQAELLSRKIFEIDNGINLELKNNILLKTKNTEHQTRIKNRQQRMENVIGSFAIKTGKEFEIEKRNIILIDDILTTGATLSEAKKVLKKAGARKVVAFTVAH